MYIEYITLLIYKQTFQPKKNIYWVWDLGDIQTQTYNQNQFGFRFRI